VRRNKDEVDRRDGLTKMLPGDRTEPKFVRDLFRDTAPYYDTVNQIFSLGSGGWYRRRCLVRAGLKAGDHLLDVAVGTGLIASSALKIVGSDGVVIGLDISEAMLDEARRKLDIPLVQGTAEALPFADETLDFLVMGYAIRHIADLDKCLLEFRRVLKPGGTILLLEVSSPSRPIYRTTLARYLGRGVPFLSQLVTRQPKVRTLMTYHWETMKDCLPPSAIIDAVKGAGFASVVCEGWFDLFRSYAGRK
jgi:demethylmenaquinone methyltransferase/2-methoxy-6-polyprenyl-1,4-benzoquinol methylase